MGGIIPDKTDYQAKRNSRRKELGLTQEDILIVHSGKLVAEKKDGGSVDSCAED